MSVMIDIETLPDLDMPDDARRALVAAKVPKNYKDAAKIEAWIASHADEAWRRQALDPLHGRILCIGVWDLEGHPTCLWPVDHAPGSLDAEREILHHLEGMLGRRAQKLVAHNGVAFDFPFLRKRAMKHGMYTLAKRMCQEKPWSETHGDTRVMWCQPSRPGAGSSLDALAEFFNIKRHNPISGADVYDRWAAEDYVAIRKHVLDDVRVLGRLYQILQRCT